MSRRYLPDQSPPQPLKYRSQNCLTLSPVAGKTRIHNQECALVRPVITPELKKILAPRKLSSKDIAAKCTLGCPVLDASLRGGVACGSITEFVGESTAGKTQACLRLLLTAQWPISQGGLNGASLYIHTEGHFPRRRLQELADCNCPAPLEGIPQSTPKNDPLDDIFVEKIFELVELWELLERIPALLRAPVGSQHRRVRLIVVDSIAALFRSEFEDSTEYMVSRAGEMFRIAARMKRLAAEFDVAVVVTNQVMDCMANNWSCGMDTPHHSGNLSAMVTSMRQVAPALGLAWSNCITTRIFLSRYRRVESQLDEHGGTDWIADEADRWQDASGGKTAGLRKPTAPKARRRMQVVFSSYLPYASCDYVIDKGGLRGLKP